MILKKEEALAFYAEFYLGEHHIPGKLQEWGEGWYVVHSSSMATFDFAELTRLVVMAHDQCIRVEIKPHAFHYLKIIIHKREGREGPTWKHHPTLEDHAGRIRKALESRRLKTNSNHYATGGTIWPANARQS